MFIYKIFNSVNCKVYIGQTTVSIDSRWKQHKLLKGACRAIESAIRKYGAEAFSIEQVAVAETQTELNDLEQFWIEKLNTISPRGYNIKGGGGGAGKMHDETKALMREIGKRPERLVQLAEMRSRPDVRAKQKANKIERWSNPENKARYGAAISASLNKPDVKERRSAALRAAWAKPENKRKMLTSLAAAHTPHAEAKRAASMRRAWALPGATEQRASAIRVAKSTPEFKARYAATNVTPETKARRSAAASAKRLTAEQKAARSAMMTGKKRGPYKNCKPHPAHADNWANPEWRAMVMAKQKAALSKQLESLKITNALPETHLRRSLAAAKWQAERKVA